MKLEATGNFSYVLEITKDDCLEHGIDFEKIKEYYIYKQNKSLYDKVPDYYFEPPTPPKKPGLLKRLFKTKKAVQSEGEEKTLEIRTEMDIYFQKKLDDLREKGLPLYTKADLQKLYQNKSKLIALVSKYAALESKKEQPSFEDRGGFSYHYEITENDTIIFDVDTLMRIM